MPQPGVPRRVHPARMDQAIAETWESVDAHLESLLPLNPEVRCCIAMCNDPAVIGAAREEGDPRQPSVTPLDGSLCWNCAWWEAERASLSGLWPDPRTYLAYVKAGLCVCIGTEVAPLAMTAEAAERLRGSLDAAFADVFGPRSPVTPPPPSPDLRALCFRGL